MLGMKGPQGCLLEVRMQFDLVDDGDDTGGIKQGLKVPDIEVAYANGSGQPFVAQLNHGFPGIDVFVLFGYGPVNEIEIDIIEPELVQAGFKCLARFLVTVIRVPDLGGDEDVITRQAGVAQAGANPTFVVVHGGGIDAPVAQIEGRADDAWSDVVVNLPDAATELGSVTSIVKGNVRVVDHAW